MNDNILFQPLPGPQTDFFKSWEDYVLFGGARGPGKTDCLVAEAATHGHIANYRCLYLMRTFKRLQESLDRANKLFPKIKGHGWRRRENEWVSKEGAIIRFGHCQHKKDRFNYMGHEYQRVLYDQLDQFLEIMFTDINTSCRSAIPGFNARVFGTANPGGVGHLFLKKTFVDVCRPIPNGEKIYNEEFDVWWQPELAGPTYTDEVGLTYKYIPGKVFENPYLLKNDPAYVLRLKKLPKDRRKAQLEGDWNVFVGQYFGEWLDEVHVINDFSIPHTWKKYASFDFGSDAPFVIEFHAVNPETGELITFDEYWASGKNLRYHAHQFARKLLEVGELEYILYPHDMKRRIDKEAAALIPMIEQFHEYVEEGMEELGFYSDVKYKMAVSGPGSRIMRWDAMKVALEEPNWYIMRKCKKLIETIKVLIHNDSNPDDIEESDDDHWAECAGHAVLHVARSRKGVSPKDRYQRPLKKKDAWGKPAETTERMHWMEY